MKFAVLILFYLNLKIVITRTIRQTPILIRRNVWVVNSHWSDRGSNRWSFVSKNSNSIRQMVKHVYSPLCIYYSQQKSK